MRENLQRQIFAAYNDTWAGKHLAKASGSIRGKRTLEVVLGVEAGVEVDTRPGGGGRRLKDGRDGGGNGLGLGLVVDAWHCELTLR